MISPSQYNSPVEYLASLANLSRGKPIITPTRVSQAQVFYLETLQLFAEGCAWKLNDSMRSLERYRALLDEWNYGYFAQNVVEYFRENSPPQVTAWKQRLVEIAHTVCAPYFTTSKGAELGSTFMETLRNMDISTNTPYGLDDGVARCAAHYTTVPVGHFRRVGMLTPKNSGMGFERRFVSPVIPRFRAEVATSFGDMEWVVGDITADIQRVEYPVLTTNFAESAVFFAASSSGFSPQIRFPGYRERDNKRRTPIGVAHPLCPEMCEDYGGIHPLEFVAVSYILRRLVSLNGATHETHQNLIKKLGPAAFQRIQELVAIARAKYHVHGDQQYSREAAVRFSPLYALFQFQSSVVASF